MERMEPDGGQGRGERGRTRSGEADAEYFRLSTIGKRWLTQRRRDREQAGPVPAQAAFVGDLGNRREKPVIIPQGKQEPQSDATQRLGPHLIPLCEPLRPFEQSEPNIGSPRAVIELLP